MKSIAMLAAALLTLPLAIGSPAHADNDLVTRVGWQTPAPLACWSGYHLDRNGACQPNIQEVSRYCPQPGLMYQPAPWGYTCVPIPAGY